MDPEAYEIAVRLEVACQQVYNSMQTILNMNMSKWKDSWKVEPMYEVLEKVYDNMDKIRTELWIMRMKAEEEERDGIESRRGL